jgi:hypothetical protein
MNRRVLTFFLAAGFVLFALWWALYTPAHPEDIYRPIPLHVSFVSTHVHLGPRVDAFLRHPASAALRQAADIVLPDELPLSPWLARLLPYEVAVARISPSHPLTEPVTFITTRLGFQGQQMRWLLPHLKSRGIVRADRYHGHDVWLVPAGGSKGRPLLVAHMEGILTIRLSSDPRAMRMALETFDGNRPSVRDSESFRQALANRQMRDATDWGWALQGVPPFADDHQEYILAEASIPSPEAIRIRLVTNTPWPEAVAFASPPALKPLDRLLGALPFCFIHTTPELVKSSLDRPFVPPSAQAIGEFITRHAAPQGIFASLIGDDYSARLYGVKIPLLLIGFRPLQPQTVLSAASGTIAKLNREMGWQLGICALTNTAGQVVHAIGTVQGGPLKNLPIAESPAYGLCGGWFLIGSSAGALSRVMERYESVESTAGAAGCPLQPLFTPDCGDPLRGWIDLPTASRAVSTALAIWALKETFEGGDRENPTLTRLQAARRWIGALGELGHLQFRIEPSPQGTACWMETRRPAPTSVTRRPSAPRPAAPT